MTTPKMYPPPVKNPLRFPLILVGTPLNDSVKPFTVPFGKEAQWEKRWDRALKRHPQHFLTIYSPFFDHETGHTNYLPLINDAQQYRDDAAGFDWDSLVSDAKANAEEEDGQMIGQAFIGTVFDVMPSGKFYMPWAHGNVTPWEAAQDEVFREHLEAEASERGGSIEGGEGDPCDLFFVMSFQIEDTDDVTDTSAADE